METELKSLAKVAFFVAASMSYARFVSGRVKPGKLRLLCLVPVFYLLLWLPWLFSTIHLRGIFAFFLIWLALFKLLLLSFDAGPLSPSLPFLPFLLSASLPLKFKFPVPDPNNQSSSSDDPKIQFSLSGDSEIKSLSPGDSFFLFSRLKIRSLSVNGRGRVLPSAVKAVLLAVLVSQYRRRDQIHPYLMLIMYLFHVYLAVDLVLAVTAALAELLLRGGLKLEPQFDAPFRAASLTEFWGRRWNLMVPTILRASVYVPVRARYGRAAGVLAAFLVSGIMHEVIFYYMLLAPPSGELTAFFLLHGACVVVEGATRRLWRPPAVVTVPATHGMLVITAVWLFSPPILRNGGAERVAAECVTILEFFERVGSEMLSGFSWV